MALCKRALHISDYRNLASVFPRNSRHVSDLVVNSNGKRAFLVDTLQLVRGLEAQGLPSNQAEAITSAITQVLHDSLENVSHSLVSRSELKMSEMLIKSDLSKFKSEVQSSQEHHFSLLQLETEKIRNDVEKMRSELRNDIEKMRSELRYEIDKVTAGQRLDLNLERGRTRDELSNQSAETTALSNKVEREVHALKAQLEAAKYDVVKYCIGTLVSISAVGLAVIRILL